jgi:hypothetical protein
MAQDFEIPASGEIAYQYFEVPTNFTEDKWMQAGEVRAGDRSHVHHIIVYVREPGRTVRPTSSTVRSILNTTAAPCKRRHPSSRAIAAARRAGSAPPQQPRSAAAGRPPGAAATPCSSTGRSAKTRRSTCRHREANPRRLDADLPGPLHDQRQAGTRPLEIGLVFAKEPPQREIRTGSDLQRDVRDSAGAGEPSGRAEGDVHRRREDLEHASAHAPARQGHDLHATYPDGRKEILLRVPKYDFGWQTDYWLAQPLSLPKGTKVHVSAHFDNSPANRANPDPKATVRWGDQTWEEMMIGFFTYTVEGAAAPRIAQR